MGVIYEVHHWVGLIWHDKVTKFHEDWLGNPGNIKAITSAIWEAAVLALLMGRIYDVCRWDELRWHDTYIPSFMTIGSGIQLILRVHPKNLGGCGVGITVGGDLYCTTLRWPQVAWYMHAKCHEDWYRCSSNTKVLPQQFERL
jgi:hypothetical protein